MSVSAKRTTAPRILCAGILVLDNVVMAKVPVKWALAVAEMGEPSRNVQP